MDRGLTSNIRDSSCDRLYSQSKVMKEKQDKIKEETARKELEKCTFAPKTNLTPKPSIRSASSSPARGRSTTAKATNQSDLTDRMKRFEENKLKKLSEAVKAKNDKEISKATFTPAIIRR